MAPTSPYGPASKKRADRMKVPGTCCPQCRAYYMSLNLSQVELQDKLDKVSRHREFPRPPTPDHYWELDFPSDEECIKRGYMDAEPQPHTFKPLTSNKYYKPIAVHHQPRAAQNLDDIHSKSLRMDNAKDKDIS